MIRKPPPSELTTGAAPDHIVAMRILITGAAGTIGAGIASALRRNHQVQGLNIRDGPEVDVRTDVRDEAAVSRALEGAQAIVHTAALHAPHVGRVPDQDFWRINVEGTQTLLDLAVRHGIDRFVLTSSTSVYGQALVPISGGGAVWIEETVEPQPRDIYDVTKLAAEERVQQASGRCLKSIILRMSRCFPESTRTMALHRLHRGIDRRDVVAAHLLALDQVSEAAKTYIVSGSSPFLRDDVDALLTDADTVIRKRVPAVAKAFAQRGWQLPQTLDRVYSIDRIVRELGFRPQFGSLHVLNGDCVPLPAE